MARETSKTSSHLSGIDPLPSVSSCPTTHSTSSSHTTALSTSLPDPPIIHNTSMTSDEPTSLHEPTTVDLFTMFETLDEILQHLSRDLRLGSITLKRCCFV